MTICWLLNNKYKLIKNKYKKQYHHCNKKNLQKITIHQKKSITYVRFLYLIKSRCVLS